MLIYFLQIKDQMLKDKCTEAASDSARLLFFKVICLAWPKFLSKPVKSSIFSKPPPPQDIICRILVRYFVTVFFDNFLFAQIKGGLSARIT